jgi:hypothetical protein
MRRLIVRGPRSRRGADRLAYGRFVAESMKASDYFPDPIPALTKLVADLAVAEVEGPAIIASAGISLKDSRGPSRPNFAVKRGKTLGAVILLARAVARKAPQEWQDSIDKERWMSAGTTLEAETTLSGLAVGTRDCFRLLAKVREVRGD